MSTYFQVSVTSYAGGQHLAWPVTVSEAGVWSVVSLVLIILYPFRAYILLKKGNALFNDALNTFYLRLYGVRNMVKDHSDSERRNPLPPHGILFPISTNGSFICIIPQNNTYHGLCYNSRGALAYILLESRLSSTSINNQITVCLGCLS